MSTKKKAKIPEWFLMLKDDARINAKDLIELTGLSPGSLNRIIALKELPEPTYDKSKYSCNKAKQFWTVAQIKQWLKATGRAEE